MAAVLEGGDRGGETVLRVAGPGTATGPIPGSDAVAVAVATDDRG